MKEIPILFSAPMVRAILAGTKTQTRRVMKPQPSEYMPSPNRHPTTRTEPYFDAYNGGPYWCWWSPDNRQGPDWIKCPYGVPGDRLWVREAWKPHSLYAGMKPSEMPKAKVFYRADDSYAPSNTPWVPGIHMPRWASRILLEVTEIRVQRLQDISEADAMSEGAPQLWTSGDGHFHEDSRGNHLTGFAGLWEHINGPGSWDANPWVWAVSFSPLEASHVG